MKKKLKDGYCVVCFEQFELFTTYKDQLIYVDSKGVHNPIVYSGKITNIPPDVAEKHATQVDFYPDEGFPLSEGYMLGEDDSVSTLYTDAWSAFVKTLTGPYCIIYKE